MHGPWRKAEVLAVNNTQVAGLLQSPWHQGRHQHLSPHEMGCRALTLPLFFSHLALGPVKPRLATAPNRFFATARHHLETCQCGLASRVHQSTHAHAPQQQTWGVPTLHTHQQLPSPAATLHTTTCHTLLACHRTLQLACPSHTGLACTAATQQQAPPSSSQPPPSSPTPPPTFQWALHHLPAVNEVH
jgi:hypothetical protein